MKDEVRHGD